MAEVSMKWGELECGFFRYLDQIYFAMPYEKMIFHFPVKNGKICREADGSNIFSGQEISVIPAPEMVHHGMDKGVDNNPFEDRFWS